MERAEITLHGHRFIYRSAGSGPLLVLLHGIAGSSATWEDVIPWLSERHTVIQPGVDALPIPVRLSMTRGPSCRSVV